MRDTDRLRHINSVLDRITYKNNYVICTQYVDSSIVEVYVEFQRPDIFTGEDGWGRGGTARIYPDATDGDIVRTVFGLIQAIEIHECREWFKVDDSQVFGPHIELDALIDAGRHVQGQ